MPQLVALLQDAVESGASLGFWRPLDAHHAQLYWQQVIAEIERGERLLLVALRDGAVLGSVQLALPQKQNALRRAEIQKLMVQRSARRQGIGQALMRAIEQLAQQEKRTTLILDTSQGSDAERLYRAIGYQLAGIIPHYTIEADGSELATVMFYKSLNSEQ